MKFHRCKGMRDLSPEEMAAFRRVEGACRDCCSSWGYQEIRTPTIEYLYLFTAAGTLTPGRLGKVYSFLDWDGWSGERVVLRPDGTIPVARYYTERFDGTAIARLFYVANIFAFEEDATRSRERWQCGVELIGAGSAAADAELVSLALEILAKLGLGGVELRLSHAGLIRALLAGLGLTPAEQAHLLDEILDGGTGTLTRVVKSHPELEGIVVPLLSFQGQSAGFLRNQRALLAGSAGDVLPMIDDFLATVSVLDSLGIKYQINLASGVGFEYYTGIIFQMMIKGEKVGGGGRYDDLIPAMGGGKVPASGFALYLDRLVDLIKLEMASGRVPTVAVRLMPGGSHDLKKAFMTAGRLREAGFSTELELNGRAASARWVVEIGPEPGKFTLVDRLSSQHCDYPSVEKIVKALREEIGGD